MNIQEEWEFNWQCRDQDSLLTSQCVILQCLQCIRVFCSGDTVQYKPSSDFFSRRVNPTPKFLASCEWKCSTRDSSLRIHLRLLKARLALCFYPVFTWCVCFSENFRFNSLCVDVPGDSVCSPQAEVLTAAFNFSWPFNGDLHREFFSTIFFVLFLNNGFTHGTTSEYISYNDVQYQFRGKDISVTRTESNKFLIKVFKLNMNMHTQIVHDNALLANYYLFFIIEIIWGKKAEQLIKYAKEVNMTVNVLWVGVSSINLLHGGHIQQTI